jgi:hypothetical protein
MLFIDDELSKALRNSKCNDFFIESFKGKKSSNTTTKGVHVCQVISLDFE